jgi:hypothetical protein
LAYRGKSFLGSREQKVRMHPWKGLKPLCFAAFVITSSLSLAPPALADDPGRIDAYVTPYYNSAGLTIRIGRYSAGLASKNQGQLVATILQMKKQWSRLSFIDLYVGAIRLYDFGYRNEATFWFYSAQYDGRQFALLVNRDKLGSIGDPGFELYHAQDAFFELVGPDINGYAFGDVDTLVAILRKVQSANRTVRDLQRIYPGTAFADKSSWDRTDEVLNSGLGALALQSTNRKAEIAQRRKQNGTQARFSHLTSKQFPGGL